MFTNGFAWKCHLGHTVHKIINKYVFVLNMSCSRWRTFATRPIVLLRPHGTISFYELKLSRPWALFRTQFGVGFVVQIKVLDENVFQVCFGWVGGCLCAFVVASKKAYQPELFSNLELCI